MPKTPIDDSRVDAAVERLRQGSNSACNSPSYDVAGWCTRCDQHITAHDIKAVCDALAEAQREIDGDPQQCASSDPMISLGLKGMLAVCIEERIEAEALARTLAQTMDAIDDYDQGVHGFRAILADPRVKALLKD